jgi:hypothetical protein
MDAGKLLAALQAQGLPVLGVSIGSIADQASWRIDYARGATDQEKTATRLAILKFQVPTSITRFQAREALRRAGRLQEIEDALALIDGESTEALQTAKTAWDAALEFRRNSAILTAFAQLLTLTDAQLDALFISASQIEA